MNTIDFIKQFEGLSLKSYPDPVTGKEPFTIGYGTTTYLDGSSVKLTDKPITKEEAEELLNARIINIKYSLSTIVTHPLTENQESALCSFVYNLGLGALKVSTLLRLLNKGKIQDAADEFPKWCNANGKQIPGLLRRRQAERELFLKV